MPGYDPLDWYEAYPVIGAMPAERAVQSLRAVGLEEDANVIQKEIANDESIRRTSLISLRDLLPIFKTKPPKLWEYTGHTFGFITAGDSSQKLDICHAGNIDPDPSLKGGSVRITLDYLRAADYPGNGQHQILFDFYAQNQMAQQTENIHFHQTFKATSGDAVGVIGYPIFIGLNVRDGIAFRIYTVNIANKDDKSLLEFLDTDVFRSGLTLATVAQPAIAPLTDMAVGLTQMFLSRHENVPVQDVYMGLDFADGAVGARLAEGSYVVVQIPDDEPWDWGEWVFDRDAGRVVNKMDTDTITLIPYESDRA